MPFDSEDRPRHSDRLVIDLDVALFSVSSFILRSKSRTIASMAKFEAFRVLPTGH
jgi:hypothetical protein